MSEQGWLIEVQPFKRQGRGRYSRKGEEPGLRVIAEQLAAVVVELDKEIREQSWGQDPDIDALMLHAQRAGLLHAPRPSLDLEHGWDGRPVYVDNESRECAGCGEPATGDTSNRDGDPRPWCGDKGCMLRIGRAMDPEGRLA